MTRNRKRLLIGLAALVLYNLVAPGGLSVERSFALALAGSSESLRQGTRVSMPGNAEVVFFEAPTNRRIRIPFVFHDQSRTYPFRLDFVSHTRGRPLYLSERGRLDRTDIEVTQVRYGLMSDDATASTASLEFSAPGWTEVTITGPGEWILATEGHTRGAPQGRLTFPVIIIDAGDAARVDVQNGLDLFFSSIP